MQTMSVKKLIARLKLIEKQCGDLPVVLSSDSEGNNFGQLITRQLVYAMDLY
jgi:hypothetical protein